MIIVLFGARKLPDAARSLGKSMRILKTEVSGPPRGRRDATAASAPVQAAPAQLQAPAAPAASADAQAQIDALSKQLADLQQSVKTTGQRAGQLGRPPPARTRTPPGTRDHGIEAFRHQGCPHRGRALPALQAAGNPEGRMPLMDHLRELRNRVVKVALAIIVGMVVSWASTTGSGRSCSGPSARPSDTAR